MRQMWSTRAEGPIFLRESRSRLRLKSNAHIKSAKFAFHHGYTHTMVIDLAEGRVSVRRVHTFSNLFELNRLQSCECRILGVIGFATRDTYFVRRAERRSVSFLPYHVRAFPALDETVDLAFGVATKYFARARLSGYKENVAQLCIPSDVSSAPTNAYEMITVATNALRKVTS